MMLLWLSFPTKLTTKNPRNASLLSNCYALIDQSQQLAKQAFQNVVFTAGAQILFARLPFCG